MSSRYPNWKICTPTGEYVASCKYPEDAAALVAILGRGSTVSWSRRVLVWKEGDEAFLAAESYDGAADVMRARLDGYAKAQGWRPA